MNNTAVTTDKGNKIISNEEFGILRDFLFNGKTSFKYPEIQSNERVMCFLAGLTIKTMLVKLCGQNSNRYIRNYMDAREFNFIKTQASDLFEKSAHLFPFDNTTPLFKSLFVIFVSDSISMTLRKNPTLRHLYWAGLFDEGFVKKIVEFMED